MIVNGALCPAARVSGSAMPPSVNCELVELTDDIVTLEPPALIVPPRLSVEPKSTSPNDKLAGAIVICPTPVPFPESGTLTTPSDAFDVTVSVPLLLPVAAGANAIVIVTLWPAPTDNGSVTALRLNPLPVTAACEIETPAPPVFVSVTDNVWLLPVSAFPKFNPATLGDR